jgi:hypothetical protein
MELEQERRRAMGDAEVRLAAKEAVHNAVISKALLLLEKFKPRKVLLMIKKEKGDYWYQVVKRAFLERGLISENGRS